MFMFNPVTLKYIYEFYVRFNDFMRASFVFFQETKFCDLFVSTLNDYFSTREQTMR